VRSIDAIIRPRRALGVRGEVTNGRNGFGGIRVFRKNGTHGCRKRRADDCIVRFVARVWPSSPSPFRYGLEPTIQGRNRSRPAPTSLFARRFNGRMNDGANGPRRPDMPVTAGVGTGTRDDGTCFVIVFRRYFLHERNARATLVSRAGYYARVYARPREKITKRPDKIILVDETNVRRSLRQRRRRRRA